MYQHPQALDINARYYRSEALHAADQRRLVRISQDAGEAGSQNRLAGLAGDAEQALILLTTLAVALVVAATVLF